MLCNERLTNGHSMDQFPKSNGLVVDGNYIDGSWELSVTVEDLYQVVNVRVLGDLTLGGLMHRIVENINIPQSWSDHAIWWSDRNMWLLHHRTTLDQYGIQSDAKLQFRRMHGSLQVILPSLIPIVLRVNYSSRVCNVVSGICKQLNIRHPEELSLMFPVTREHLKSNIALPVLRHGLRRSNVTSPHSHSEAATLSRTQQKHLTTSKSANISPYETLRSSAGTMMRLRSEQSLDLSDGSSYYTDCLSSRSAKAVFIGEWLLRPNNLVQKARLNSCWLDSSRSLMEHGIEPPRCNGLNESPPTLYLCFKYFNFYDLNLKYDEIRIHQLFQQARWSLLSGAVDCTEDEMVVFAAYQLQAQLHSTQHDGSIDPSSYNYSSTLGTSRIAGHRPCPDPIQRQYMTLGTPVRGIGDRSSLLRLPSTNSPLSNTSLIDGNSHFTSSDYGTNVDEVDELLAGLEQSCGVANEPGSATRSFQHNSPLSVDSNVIGHTSPRGFDISDTSEIPTLQDSLRVLKDQNLLIRRYKVYWVVIRETMLYLFKSETELNCPLFVYNLRDCSVSPQVNAAANKYILKLNVLTESCKKIINTDARSGSGEVLTRESTRDEIFLRFDTAEQYTRWFAACRLTSKGKTLASRVAYERELNAIWEMLRLQVPGVSMQINSKDYSLKPLSELADFCSERIIRKARSKQHLRQRIAEAQANLRDLPSVEAKYKYIQAWQRLNGFGRSYFTVSFERNINSAKIPNTSGGLFSVPTDDLIAIHPSGFEIVSAHTGDILRAWSFSELKSWDVNWEAGRISLDFRNERILFRPLCANCKTIAEFLGGYICLTQRTPEGNQEFNERMFLRLTAAHE